MHGERRRASLGPSGVRGPLAGVGGGWGGQGVPPVAQGVQRVADVRDGGSQVVSEGVGEEKRRQELML